MTRTRRVLTFGGFIAAVLSVQVLFFDHPIPSGEVNVVAFSSLVMLALVGLLVEPFFTRPTDVVASTTSILLVLSPLHAQLARFGVWYRLFWGYNFILLLTALLALFLFRKEAPRTAKRNQWSKRLTELAGYFGSGAWLYFLLFLLTAVFYWDTQELRFLILTGLAGFVLVATGKNPWAAWARTKTSQTTELGTVFAIEGSNAVVARLFESAPPVARFSEVAVCQRSGAGAKRVERGLAIEEYNLDDQRWLRILISPALAGSNDLVFKDQDPNSVFLVSEQPPDTAQSLAGVVTVNTKIEEVRFSCTGLAPVEKGDLIYADCNGRKVNYQVVQGTTELEGLEKRNKAAGITGEAIQLGEWQEGEGQFETFGWVPEINTPLFKVQDDLEVPVTIDDSERVIGYVPRSKYPVVLDLEDAVSHHLAILGTTGSGKSVFCRHIVRELIDRGTRVIVVDFTGEYAIKLADGVPDLLIQDANRNQLFEWIEELDQEMAEFKNNRTPGKISSLTSNIRGVLESEIKRFLNGNQMLGLFELPDVSGTTASYEFTERFFAELFALARAGAIDEQLCVVLEEAHTVVPEWSFIGAADEKKARGLVNKLGQIALQGRKYRIGFIVVAQRTANVSKTVLTQCNSVVAFQQFDRTSTKFLHAHMGPTVTDALPTLKPRHGVAAGKAFRSGPALIFRVPDIEEPELSEPDQAPVDSASVPSDDQDEPPIDDDIPF